MGVAEMGVSWQTVAAGLDRSRRTFGAKELCASGGLRYMFKQALPGTCVGDDQSGS